MFKGGANTASLTKANGINVGSSAYGKAVKLVYGLAQVSPDLVWLNDWGKGGNKSTGKGKKGSSSMLSVVTGDSSGGKKASKKGGNQPHYFAAIDLLLGHSPIRGVLSAWYNNQKFAVNISSESGVISGGGFTFTPSGGASEQVITAVVSGPLFQFTAPNFVADRRVEDATLDIRYLERSDPSLPPGANQYTVTSGGLYTFNATQGGHTLKIDYFHTVGGTPATLAGILAVSVHEEFTATFNDYGGPGTITEFGTWERPLWNESFPVPGRIDAGAYTARRPYSWNWNGVTPTVNIPTALNGLPVTVYYATPVIFKSDGTFFSDTITPLELMNLEFEQVFASGAEYVNHPTEQLQQNWCAGLGSVAFDLGVGNAMPNLNLETIGAFTQWPSGDADVADVITDIVSSGPVLP